MKKKDLLISTPKSYKATFILAHGAGAPMDSDWMNSLTKAVLRHKIQVIRFEFPYMAERRENGKKRPPNSAKQLIECWSEVIKLINSKKTLIIGGKSMGGRIASLIANDNPVHALVCLGFPFHAPGKPMGERVDLLKTVKVKTLILQGERDSMGSKAEIKKLKLQKNIKMQYLEDGDHSFKPRKSSGFTLDEHIEAAANHIDQFVSQLL